MKKMIFTMLLTFAFAGSALAQLVEIDGKITFDSQDGAWAGALNNNGNIQIASTKMLEAFGVVFISPNTNGQSLQQAAEAALADRNGRNLRPVGSGYLFDATQPNGRGAIWYVALDKDSIIQIRMMNYSDELLTVVQSVQVK